MCVSMSSKCTQTLVEQCPADDPDTDFNMGCVLFKVGGDSTY